LNKEKHAFVRIYEVLVDAFEDDYVEKEIIGAGGK
jgi:hypothetical protein